MNSPHPVLGIHLDQGFQLLDDVVDVLLGGRVPLPDPADLGEVLPQLGHEALLVAARDVRVVQGVHSPLQAGVGLAPARTNKHDMRKM